MGYFFIYFVCLLTFITLVILSKKTLGLSNLKKLILRIYIAISIIYGVYLNFVPKEFGYVIAIEGNIAVYILLSFILIFPYICLVWLCIFVAVKIKLKNFMMKLFKK
jgi:hypothetical protein